ncbi:MAG: glycoside hydrolase family 9 protein [Fibrobacterota bacterium]
MRKISAVSLMILCTLAAAFADALLRVNKAGYFADAEKRAVLCSDKNLTGSPWKLKNTDGTVLLSGTVGESVHGSGPHSVYNFNYEIPFSDVTETGKVTLSLPDADLKKTFPIEKSPYEKVIAANLRWFKVQRSGTKNTLDHEGAHFGDTACYVYREEEKGVHSWDNWKEDDESKRVDVLGGWYAAGGNYAKFTSATGYATYYLLKSYQTNPALFDNASGQMGTILEEARFGLEYLLKVMPDDEDFIIQVGGFDGENGIRLPEDDKYDGKRNCYSAYSKPQMAWAAAALALGSEVFAEKGDADFAEKCRTTAVKIYDRATSDEAYTTWLQKEYDQFKDESAGDNLLIAAGQLYSLTGDEKYLTQAKEYSREIKNAWWAAWNMQHMMGHVGIAEDFDKAREFFMADLNEFAATSEGNIWGFPMDYGFSNLYGSYEIAAAALRYRKVSGNEKFSDLVTDVINYTYGVNNWGVSFVAMKELDNSVHNINMPVYKLQTHLFPEGVPVLGPCDTKGHKQESKWILDDISMNYCHEYNTPAVTFYDHADDYMTTDAWIYGAADNIYLLTLATTLLTK